jgi:hypothetical protein
VVVPTTQKIKMLPPFYQACLKANLSEASYGNRHLQKFISQSQLAFSLCTNQVVQWLECISIVANSILLKKYEAIKIIFIRIDFLTRKTFSLEIILDRGLLHNTNRKVSLEGMPLGNSKNSDDQDCLLST